MDLAIIHVTDTFIRWAAPKVHISWIIAVGTVATI